MTIDEAIAEKATALAKSRAREQVDAIRDVVGFAELPAAKSIAVHIDDLEAQIFEREFEKLRDEITNKVVDDSMRDGQRVEHYISAGPIGINTFK